MKKLLATLVLGAMVFTLVGCGDEYYEDESYADEYYEDEGGEGEALEAGDYYAASDISAFCGTWECAAGTEDADLGLGENYQPYLEYFMQLTVYEDGTYLWQRGITDDSLQNVYDTAWLYFEDELVGLQDRNGWTREEAMDNWAVDLGMSIDDYVMTNYVNVAAENTYSEFSGVATLEDGVLYLDVEGEGTVNTAFLTDDGIGLASGEALYAIG